MKVKEEEEVLIEIEIEEGNLKVGESIKYD